MRLSYAAQNGSGYVAENAGGSVGRSFLSFLAQISIDIAICNM
jgi:hypothetical protein